MKRTTMNALVLVFSSTLALGASVKAYAADSSAPAPASSTAPASSNPNSYDKSGSASQYIDDATITSRVKSKFATDSTVSALHINVETAKGVVTLSGNVASQAEKDQAIALAKATPDVKSVKSSLSVKSSATPASTTR